MPTFGWGAPSEIRGWGGTQLRRGRPAESCVDPVRRRWRQVAGDGLYEIGSTLIYPAFCYDQPRLGRVDCLQS